MDYFEERAKMSPEEIERKEKIYFSIVKEITKFILFEFFFITITGKIINDLAVYYSGGLIEYLKHDTLRLFTDSYYIDIAIGYAHPMNEYFDYIINDQHVELYLWIIPYCIAILCSYPAYWLAHKIVDRSGIGATKRLNFLHFIFIFIISNILSRLFAYDVLLPIIGTSIIYDFWWYIFYKLIKIAVLKIEERRND